MIIGWRSPIDGKTYALEDFAALDPVIPEAVLRAMTKKATLDTRHTGTNITITGGLSCPRKTLVHRMLPTTPDPSKMWKMQRGTWLHECVGLSLGENDAWWTEEIAHDHCVYEGELFGMTMSCLIDALRKDYSVLMDWKFRADGAERWIDPMGRAKDEDSVQLNLARMLIEQSIGRELPDMQMYVWVMSGQTVRTTVPYMATEQIAAVRPGGGSFTVGEIFKQLSTSMTAWKDQAKAAGTTVENLAPEVKQSIIASLPMVGETMYQNKRTPSRNMCTNYCEVQEECFNCSGGI